MFPGEFISPNVTIIETVDEETGEIVVACSVWAYPRPNIQLFIETVVSIESGTIYCNVAASRNVFWGKIQEKAVFKAIFE